MELTFLGRGAGFNPNEGSTAAYFIDKGELFLIDCGESIFRTALDRNIFDSVTALNLFITHTHSDHVGSLGSLMLYAFAKKKIPVTIIIDENMSYLPSIRTLLVIYGLTENMYRYVDTAELNGKYSLFSKVRYIKTKHTDEVESCAIIFETDNGLVFFSGDINNPAPIIDMIESGNRIDKIYIDTSSERKNSHHTTVHQVNEFVPENLKSRIYCMHINDTQCITDALAYGFKVVSVSN